ncbi:MAG: HDOD domain-containing protein [Pseudomonadota bacterium]
MQLDPISFIQTVPSLSALPAIYYRLNDAINNPSVSLKDIAGIIEKDPALAAQLLRIANSALFKFPSQVTTITQAITIVGTQQLKDLTLACKVISAFPKIQVEAVTDEQFWHHSIAVGIAARVLAASRRESNVERYYVIGLLHDIGRLLIYLMKPQLAGQARSICQQDHRLLFKVEDEIMQTSHSELSGLLLKHWNLPDSLWEPVLHHHNPSLARNYPDEAAVIHIADVLAHTLQLGTSGELAIPPLSPEAWEKLGLHPEQLADILQEIEFQFNESIKILRPQRLH